jgi:hypothetical protein
LEASGLDLFTRASGWLLVAALAGTIWLARRRPRALLHYLLGWGLATLTWFHLWYPMRGGLLGRTPESGLWIATLAWALLLVQLAVGHWMLSGAGRAGRGTVRFHHGTMLAIVGLTTLHVLLNSVSLHSIFRPS